MKKICALFIILLLSLSLSLSVFATEVAETDLTAETEPVGAVEAQSLGAVYGVQGVDYSNTVLCRLTILDTATGQYTTDTVPTDLDCTVEELDEPGIVDAIVKNRINQLEYMASVKLVNFACKTTSTSYRRNTADVAKYSGIIAVEVTVEYSSAPVASNGSEPTDGDITDEVMLTTASENENNTLYFIVSAATVVLAGGITATIIAITKHDKKEARH